MLTHPRALIRRGAVLAAVLLASAVFSVARAAQPEVLTQIPGDAYGVVVINNVRTLSNKISNAATRLNLTLPPDLVGFLTRTIGITKGFDANSSVAIVLLKPSKEKEAEGYFSGAQPPAVLLLPTSDAKAMLEPFAPSEADAAGISKVTVPNGPGEGYVATVGGKWVAFATSKDDLTSYMKHADAFSKTMPAETLKVFDINDLVIWGNVAKLAAGTEKTIDNVQTEAVGQIDLANLTNGQDAFTASLSRQVVTLVFAAVKEFVKDSDAAMFTMRLSDSGATLGQVSSFKPDSPMGKFVAAQGSVKPMTLQGLPDGGFLFAGAASWDGPSVAALGNYVIQQILGDETISKDPRASDLRKYFETALQAMAQVRGESVVILDPPVGGKGGYMHGAVLVDAIDANKLMDLQKEAMKNSAALSSMTGTPDIKTTTEVTPDAVTIKGVKLSKTAIKFALREDTPENPVKGASRASLTAIQTVYGAEGLTIYTGVVGKRVLMVFGSDTGTLESSIDAAQSNSDKLATSPAIMASKDQLVANPIAVGYLPVSRWITLAEAFVRPANGAAPAPGVANSPPIVFSVGVSAATATQEVHVPIATISGIRDAISALQGAAVAPAPTPALP